MVSLHAPLTECTRHLIANSEPRLLKSSAVLVNVARGGLVDTASLVAAFDEGRLAGAALDVLEQEPPPADHPLLGRANVVVTPHSAFYSGGSLLELRRKAVDEVVGVLSGRAPSYPVNAPERR